MDIIELIDQGYAWTAGRVWAVRAHDLDRPTPCTSWDLHHLLNHAFGALDLLSDTVAGRAADPRDADPEAVAQALAGTDRVGTDPVGAYRAVVERAMAVWRTPDILGRTCELPFGPAPVPVAASITLLEVVVHGWDIGQATGEAVDIPADLAEPALAFAHQALTGSKRGTAFAEEVALSEPTGAPLSASDRLVAFLGRKPAWA